MEVLAAGHAMQWQGETPKSPYRIRPNDLLKIDAIGTFVDSPIDGDFRVDESGKVQFAKPYGSITVKGLTLEEAEQAIKKHLHEDAELLKPDVSVTLTGWKRTPKGSTRRPAHPPTACRRPEFSSRRDGRK